METFVGLGLVSTLPIRNGNKKKSKRVYKDRKCKYLTYKEWKPSEKKDQDY